MTVEQLLARDDEIVRRINSDDVVDEAEYNRLLDEKAVIEMSLFYARITRPYADRP